MTDSRTKRSYACVLVVGSAFVLAACTGTTYGTGRSAGVQVVKDITGLDAAGAKKKPIDYSPRPPVVAPPVAGALPPPGAASQTAVAADWPTDPDQLVSEFKEQVAAREARQRDGDSVALADPNFTLPAGATPTGLPHGSDGTAAEGSLVSKEEEARIRKAFAAARGTGGFAVDAQGQPVRRYLTDPPAEYRLPDPEAAAAVECTPRKLRFPWQKRDPNECPRAASTNSEPF